MDRAIAVLNLFISHALSKKQQHEIVNISVVWEQNATTNYSSIYLQFWGANILNAETQGVVQ